MIILSVISATDLSLYRYFSKGITVFQDQCSEFFQTVPIANTIQRHFSAITLNKINFFHFMTLINKNTSDHYLYISNSSLFLDEP